MYLVFLRFSSNKAMASEFMTSHKEWIARGIDEGVFLVVGSLQPALGGAVIAHGIPRAQLEARVAEDPFVVNDVVKPQVFELSPAKTDPRLAFLLP
ncbi:MAG: hypothetical protein HOW73_04560 [Polyangiaceae bacterium]|nr:hypothetical protein [Polyangiaceae bacterium]